MDVATEERTTHFRSGKPHRFGGGWRLWILTDQQSIVEFATKEKTLPVWGTSLIRWMITLVDHTSPTEHRGCCYEGKKTHISSLGNLADSVGMTPVDIN